MPSSDSTSRSIRSKASSRKLRLAARLPRPVRARAIADAIAFGSPADRALFGPLLCELVLIEWATDPLESRAHATAAECLSVWRHLPGDHRRAMAVSDVEWRTAARTMLRAPAHPRCAAIAHACSELPDLVAVVPALLTSNHGDVARSAGIALQRLASRHAGGYPSDPARQVASAVVEAIGSFDLHRQRTVVEAAWRLLRSPQHALNLGRPGRALIDWLQTSDQASRSAARSILRTGSGEWLTERAIAWLEEPSTRAASIDRLSRTESAADHQAVLERAHLFERPERRAALPLLGRCVKPVSVEGITVRRVIAGSALPTRAQIGELSARSRRALPWWSGLIGVKAADRPIALEPLLADDDPSVRHALARRSSDTFNRDLLLDSDLRPARHAAIRWSLEGTPASAVRPGNPADETRLRQAQRLRASEHRFVRRVARDQAARFDLLDRSHPMSRLRARRLLQTDAPALADVIARALQDSDEQRRLNAAIIAAWLSRGLRAALGEGSDLRSALAASVTERKTHDPVASAAVRALVPFLEASSEELDAALDHPDARVRSNTIEALARERRRRPNLADRGIEAAARSTDERAHRVRAAAIRSLLAEPKLVSRGRSELHRMLTDPLGMHRVSAAWLAHRVGAVDAVAVLSELAAGDEDAAVRRRATWTLRRMVASQAVRGGGGDRS